jgi:hypothetical protein
MTTDDSQFRRSCEAKHLTKIKQLGADPGAFEFDRQLDRLRSTSAEWHDEAESYFSSLKSWSFSRYELVDLIPLFHEAHVHIDVAQRMSRDEMQLPELRFAILSDPASTVRAYASEPRKKMGETVGGVAGGSLIWFCVGLKITSTISHDLSRKQFIRKADHSTGFTSWSPHTERTRLWRYTTS